MFHLALQGLRRNGGRYLATLVAIMTGVAFFAATGFLGDRVTTALGGDVDREYANVGAAVVVDANSTSSGSATPPRIDDATTRKIQALPAVAGSAGDLSGSVAFQAADGSTFASDATGRLWVTDDQLNPLTVAEGAAPLGDGEIAVDRGTAARHNLAVGAQVTLLTPSGPAPASITGTTTFGDSDAVDDGGTVSVSPVKAFDWLNAGKVEYAQLLLRGNGSDADLRNAVQPLAPPSFSVQTGADFRTAQRDSAGGFATILKTGLQAFAALALFVGGFVIYNTFSVIVAQRLRELAVLAAIGATPKQIKRSLRFEGLLIGLVGSALGVVVGFGLTYLLVVVLGAVGVSLPGRGVTVSPTVVVTSIIAGTIITFVSVMVPARRAARTEPIEALRQASVEKATIGRGRVITSSVLVVLGAVGLFVLPGWWLGLAALVLFVGVIVAGPLVAVGGSKVFGVVIGHLGLESRLAVDNIARNPQRTATTANALLIGVFLVTLVTVAGTTMKDFAVQEVNKTAAADFALASVGGTLDPTLITQLQGAAGVEEVVPFQTAGVTMDGKPTGVSTGDFGKMASVAHLNLSSGSLADLGPGSIIVVDGLQGGGQPTPTTGSTVTLTNAQGQATEVKVVGIAPLTLDTARTGNLVATPTFTAIAGNVGPAQAFIKATGGDTSATADAIANVVRLRPDIKVTRGNETGQLISNVFDFLINAVNGLLLMSVLVALIGIVNTLSLSILERRRELGLLRVVGMVDRRVRRMVRIESVLISTLGTVTGVLVGLFMGIALIIAFDRASDAAISISLPWGLLGLVLVLGIALGFVASLIPALRSTRLEVLDAIASD